MIVAICLMVAVLLAEASTAIHETPKTSRDRFLHHKKVEQKAVDSDADLTTVSEFQFIMITKEETVAV